MSHAPSASPFTHLPRTAETHFGLRFYGVVLRVLESLAAAHGGIAAAFERHPFLTGYHGELGEAGLDGPTLGGAAEWWRDAVATWAEAATDHLPIRALARAGQLDEATVDLLFAVGLIEEDSRFAAIFEAEQEGRDRRRATLALLTAWFGPGVREQVRRLEELGIIDIVDPAAPRMEWTARPSGLVWDALRGGVPERPAPWATYRAPERLTPCDALVLPDALRGQLANVVALLAHGQADAIVVRGPRHNSRRTVVGAIARALGRGVLEVDAANHPDRWRVVGPLATLLRAVPIVALDLAPSEAMELPPLSMSDAPLAIVLGKSGGVGGAAVDRAIAITVPMPDSTARRAHWRAGLGEDAPVVDSVADRFRMTTGRIRRAAALARAEAAVQGRTVVGPADVQHAARVLDRHVLDTLATLVPGSGDWTHLAVDDDTRRELADLEARCRLRERLRTTAGTLGVQGTAGVRALLSGPSGTGKTLGARLLASALGRDLYAVNLAAVTSRYVGDLEKSLDRLLACAEELDVILLLDEGDSVLTTRTSVQTSNDRWSNAATDFLLQRLDMHDGILLITTNASEHIDSAFQRRMDVVIEFRPPDAPERWAIWRLHLPSDHLVDGGVLDDIAQRCVLNGGQIRNAALHASLLALANGGRVTTAHLDTAVRREYRKAGAVCPLRDDAHRGMLLATSP
jgi:hypothetical protein